MLRVPWRSLGVIVHEVLSWRDVCYVTVHCPRGERLLIRPVAREPETITAAPIVPQTSPAPDISSDEQVDGKLIAAIVISSIVAFVAMMAAVLFYLDRRRKRTGPRDTDSTEVEGPGFSTRASSSEKDANLTQIVEVMGDKQQRLELERNEKVMSVYEMYQMPIELEAAGLTPERGATQSGEKQGWI